MLSFDAVFRVEIDAGTIAAILTILGYSINDTIVNFDRARENNTLMRGESLRTILDTSVTQTLSRTFITSGATLLTVIALFILTSGSIKNFALNMIVGIVEGTYSTFISAFIVIEWTKWRDRQAQDGRAEEVRHRRAQEKAALAVGGRGRGRRGRGGASGAAEALPRFVPGSLPRSPAAASLPRHRQPSAGGRAGTAPRAAVPKRRVPGSDGNAASTRSTRGATTRPSCMAHCCRSDMHDRISRVTRLPW